MKTRIRGGQVVLCLTPLALCLSAALASESREAISGTSRAHTYLPAHTASLLPVGSCADNGDSDTLRSIVATAVSGDTIDLTGLHCGTITLLTGEIAVHVDDLTVNGPGRDVLTIDGNNNGRVFRHDGVGTLTLTGLTITHGVADSSANDPFGPDAAYGGCILSDHRTEQYVSPYGSVRIIDSTVTHCYAHQHPPAGDRARGGAIAAGGSITVQNSTISNNNAYQSNSGAGGGGGALFADYLITVQNSVISDNSARNALGQMRGGGISAYGDLLMSNSVVTRNFVGCDTTLFSCHYGLGGGIDAFGTVTISTSTISDNVSEATRGVQGGGLSVRGILHLSDTTLSGNSVAGTTPTLRGGGIALLSPVVGPSNLSGVTVSGNSAGQGGGLYAGAYATLTIENSTISGNSASDAGGGIFTTGTYGRGPYSAYPLSMKNSTITANVSTGTRGGAGIVDLHVPYLGNSDFQSSIIAGNTNTGSTSTYDANLATLTSAVSGSKNLIVAANVVLPPDTLTTDPMLGPLQDNGGPTWTHALLPGSPAIDAGNNVANLAFDQRGDGFLRVSGTAADIGAFELQVAPIDIIFADDFDGVARQQ